MELFGLSASNSNYWVYSSGNLSTITAEHTCSCGRTCVDYKEDTSGPFTLVMEDRGRYPDFLHCCGPGLSVFAFVISEKALNIFSDNHITGYTDAEPIRLVKENGIGFEEVKDLPQYYKLSVSGSIDLDYNEMRLKKKHHCSECGQYKLSRQKLGTSYLNLSSWRGDDICRLGTFPARIICTEKVIEVIIKNKLKGACLLDSRHLFMPQYSKNITSKGLKTI